MLKFTTYFTENTTIIVLLGGTRRAKSELPDANDQVLPPKHKLETQECVISFTFNSLIGFFGIVNTFTWICNAISGQKSRATSLPFLKVVNITWNIFIGSSSATLTSGRYSSLQPAESWLVYSNFGHAGYIQGRLLAYEVGGEAARGLVRFPACISKFRRQIIPNHESYVGSLWLFY